MKNGHFSSYACSGVGYVSCSTSTQYRHLSLQIISRVDVSCLMFVFVSVLHVVKNLFIFYKSVSLTYVGSVKNFIGGLMLEFVSLFSINLNIQLNYEKEYKVDVIGNVKAKKVMNLELQLRARLS